MDIHTPPTLSTAGQVFLSARQVFSRYGWGKTKGYEILKSNGFPNSIGGKYRLDSLIRWEESRLGSGRSSSASDRVEPHVDKSGHAAGVVNETVSIPTRRVTRGAAKKRSV